MSRMPREAIRRALRVSAIFLVVLLIAALPYSADAQPVSEVKKLTASDAEAADNFGTGVAVSGDTAVVGAYWEDPGGASDAGAAYVFSRDQDGTDNWGEVQKLTASDAEAGDWFGMSVAVSGDIAVVGAHYEDAGGTGTGAGAAYVFYRDEGGADNWGQVKKLTASDAQEYIWFGSSVAVSGDIAVVGAPGGIAGGTNRGAAYVFYRDQGGPDNWGEVKKLTASDGQVLDYFGSDVAVSGDIAVVGAWREDAGGSDAGAAYVFSRNQDGADNWGEVKKLTASDAQGGDWFGSSMAVSGDIAVVGAPDEDEEGSDAGAAYVFSRNQDGADNWGQVKKLTASDAEAGDHFGFSVAVSGTTAVVGAAWEDSAAPEDAGAAYVFERDEGGADNWGQVQKLTASDAEAGDYFGTGVAVSGDTAVVGADGEDAGAESAGAAYVFGPSPCIDRLGDTACDDPVNDPDDDGCSDWEEQAGAPYPKPGYTGAYDPNAWYDFYDVAVPAKADAVGANGKRNRAVNLGDVLAVLFYVGTSDGGGLNANGVDYDTVKGVDLDGDTDNDIPPPLHEIEEGVKYDRSVSPAPNPPWEAGPPNGAVNMSDVLATLAQVGLACTGGPPP